MYLILCSFDIGVLEVSSLEEQRFVQIRCQCISETVPEIQTGFVTSFAKIPVGLAGDLRLPCGDRLHQSTRQSKKLIESSSGYRVLRPVDDDRGFDIARR
jgi:hypothetical protein